MKLVVDASVALKWFLGFRPGEHDVERAIAVGEAIQTGGARFFSPPHWSAEVIAVLARVQPQLVEQALQVLDELSPVLVADTLVLKRAADLSTLLGHHLFDTLYHAVALETGAMLVTADGVYHGKAASLGNIVPLSEFSA